MRLLLWSCVLVATASACLLATAPVALASPSVAQTPAPTVSWLAVAANRPGTLAVREGTSLSLAVTIDDGRSWRHTTLPAGTTDASLSDDGILYAFGGDHLFVEASGAWKRASSPPGFFLSHVVATRSTLTLVARNEAQELGLWVTPIDAKGSLRAERTETSHSLRSVTPTRYRRVAIPSDTYFDQPTLWRTHLGPGIFDVGVNTCGSSDRIDWQHLHVVNGRGQLEEIPWPAPDLEYLGWWSMGADGWLYTTDDAGIVAYRGNDVVHGIGGPVGTSDVPALKGVVHDQHTTVAIYDGHLVRLQGASLAVLDTAAADLELLAVDSRGRILGNLGGALVRMTSGTFEVLKRK